MLQPGDPMAATVGFFPAVLYAVGKAFLAVLLWAAALAGFLKGPMRPWERAGAILAASVLVLALPWTDELGFALAAFLLLAHLRCHARRAAVAGPR